MERLTRRQTILDLKERLSRFERETQASRGTTMPTDTALDALLPDGGITWGTLIECFGDDGDGADIFALRIGARMLRTGGAFVVVDARSEFYPPTAAGLGISLEHTVLVRPANSRAVLWALEQALRSRAASVVLAKLGAIHDRAYRRLKLAAESGDCLGLFLRSVEYQAEPSWADVRLVIHPALSPPSALGRRLQIEVLQIRGGPSRSTIEVELTDETNDVRLVPRLARATTPRLRVG
jgi:cell division inhibitor SulA